MTPAENKKLMAEIYEAVARGDGSKFVAHLAPDVTLVLPGEHSWSGRHHGKDNVIRFYRIVAELAPGVRKTIPTRILTDDDIVVIEARGDMTSKAGVPYKNHYCLLFRLKDGMIVDIKEYLDSAMTERILGYFPAERMKA